MTVAKIEIDVDLDDYMSPDRMDPDGIRTLRHAIRDELENVPGILNVWDIEIRED